MEDSNVIAALEKIDNLAIAQGKALNIKGLYTPIVNDNEKYGNKNEKSKYNSIQLSSGILTRPPAIFFQSLESSVTAIAQLLCLVASICYLLVEYLDLCFFCCLTFFS